ncbi:MAG: TrkA family potassium uptake protein [Candidatus Promineifilaceae bacterium]|nr:TrkA family potassium uptake protein [Candidatus Promineifilaceae bacterium]
MKFRSQRSDAEFAVIGLGRFGTSLALALMEDGHSVLGIDADPVIVQRISADITYAVSCDATDEEALQEVNITAFDMVVVAIGVDFESNLLVTSALKSLGVRHVISKAVTSRQREILLRVGADRVVLPEHDAGRRLAEELIAPAVLERVHLGPDHSVAEVRVPSSLAWQSLAQLDLRRRMGVTVLVIKRGEQLLVSPTADTVLLEDDLLVILGENDALVTFSNLS